MKVFLSRPTNLSKNNQLVINELDIFLRNRSIETVTIGANTFTNDSPLVAVKSEMSNCVGAIILGFPQTYVKKGILKHDTTEECEIINKKLPTPWNQIEAAIAFAFDLPMLIIADNDISGGVFDPGITHNYIHKYDLNTSMWLDEEKFLDPFNKWYQTIIKR
ncbi:hypothetical protein [Enterococcus sp. CWB-B31]|uniref:hypothetical protein n=1 Tax=Enterococcus sp. CWB-B31 TaxID=2885159 RepID=UPI001E2D1A4A|nr:hypothetical protein [Enterococcus sp. CWB-B31]MCB5956364.1 hypothetical protein [Enterococcus sp. CWB-B31]